MILCVAGDLCRYVVRLSVIVPDLVAATTSELNSLIVMSLTGT